jgi:hypothetical protein
LIFFSFFKIEAHILKKIKIKIEMLYLLQKIEKEKSKKKKKEKIEKIEERKKKLASNVAISCKRAGKGVTIVRK